ncbi:hypothetical protein ACMFMF_000428 [Clarireedia jacksonii]
MCAQGVYDSEPTIHQNAASQTHPSLHTNRQAKFSMCIPIRPSIPPFIYAYEHTTSPSYKVHTQDSLPSYNCLHPQCPSQTLPRNPPNPTVPSPVEPSNAKQQT